MGFKKKEPRLKIGMAGYGGQFFKFFKGKCDTITTQHSLTLDELKQKESLVVISIDPARDNCGFLVERREINPLYPDFVLLAETLHLERKYFKRPRDDYACIYSSVIEYLDSQRKVFKKGDLVIVERQLTTNYPAVRLEQHIITYFQIKYPRMLIVSQDSKLKYTMFSEGPVRVPGKKKASANKRARKKWAEDKALELLKVRDDKRGVSLFTCYRGKKDDIGDTIVQCEAGCRFLGLPAVDF